MIELLRLASVRRLGETQGVVILQVSLFLRMLRKEKKRFLKNRFWINNKLNI